MRKKPGKRLSWASNGFECIYTKLLLMIMVPLNDKKYCNNFRLYNYTAQPMSPGSLKRVSSNLPLRLLSPFKFFCFALASSCARNRCSSMCSYSGLNFWKKENQPRSLH